MSFYHLIVLITIKFPSISVLILGVLMNGRLYTMILAKTIPAILWAQLFAFSPKNENNFEVIDGQQRITTLCLFLTAIYSHLKERESPQGDNIPKCWVDMIADGDEELAKQYLEQYVHKLGNLTLTGYNASLSNKPFAEKRDHRDKEGRFIGYKNGLEINSEIAKKDYWTVDDIKERTKKLVEKLMLVYQPKN